MKKKIIGSIGNIKIVTPSECAKHTDLIYEDGIIKWGVCKNPYKIKESDKGKIGYLKGKPIIAHDEERVGYKVLSITEEGVLLKRCVNGLEDLVTIVTGPANNEIWYTSTDGNVVTPYATNAFGANIVSNTYENGQGVITFDGDVTSIGIEGFEGCSKLTSIILPNSITNIKDAAFLSCSSLTSINIPKSVIVLGGSSFAGTGLVSLVLPNYLTKIGESAFDSCSGLTSITIPESITLIDGSAFFGCSNLTLIIYNGTVTQWHAVTKNAQWHLLVPETTVVTCTDGTVALS